MPTQRFPSSQWARQARLLGLALIAAGLAATPAQAQPTITLPDASPAARVAQTVGVTEIEITYHRPAVKGRTIWGGLVPYDQVWRAGANQNTTFAVSTPVSIEGKALDAGTYGLHMLPQKDRFTVIFSRQHQAWGSFSYDQAEDALRIDVKPVASSYVERLAYGFEEPTDDSTVVAMRWEKLMVPFTVKVDLGATVLDAVATQLRGLPRFGWRGWNDAAREAERYGDLDRALGWSEESLRRQRTFTNLMTKASILERRGDAAGARALRDEADPLATEADRNAYGYTLLGQGKVADAVAVFERNVALFPQSWNVHDSLGEALAAAGEKAKAITSYERAAKLATDPAQQSRIAAELDKLRGK